MTEWLVNGRPDHSISVMDRGLTYGDGLFETIAVRDGRARFLEYHLQRLIASCDRLSISGQDDDTLRAEVTELASECRSGTIKIIVTRGAGERGYAPPVNPNSTRIIGLIPDEPSSRHSWQTGIEMKFCETRIGIDPDLAGMKTLGRLDQVLARAELTDSGCQEGLMCTEDGQVICGTMCNVFFVVGGHLLTPGLARCGISGVMRRLVMEQASRVGIECREVTVDVVELLEANEIFVTNSRIGIWPVVRVESTRYEIGPTTRRLMAALTDIGVAECGG
jgi:4-amino-4-deoxychorismate lyase